MEKVFWLMWLADVMESIGFVGVICLLAFVGAIAIAAIATGYEQPEVVARVFRVARWLLVPVIVACITPNKKTIEVLAIAAAGNAAASTQLGTKSLEALNAVLDKVINKAKKD